MFSIVVPVYNKRALLRATVESALAQSFAGFELILIDDGSTDGSLEAVADVADPRLRVLRQANGGASAARNAGMAAARHGWIAFLDADDLWLPDHLAELDRIRRRFPEAGLIGTAFVRGVATRVAAGEPGDIRLIRYFEEVGQGRVPFWTSSAAVRAEAARSVGGFNDDPIGQDSEYWARLAFDYPVAASTRATAVYRLATGGIIDRARYRWRGRAIRSAADISSAAALVTERYAGAPPELRRELDLYLDRFVRWCIEHSVAIGDVGTVRALRNLYRTAPTGEEKLLMGAARLPAPAARAAFKAWGGLKSVRRRLARG